MTSAAFEAALTRRCRFAKRVGWAQSAFSVLMVIGVVGDFRKEWVVAVYLAAMGCIAVGALAMHRAMRLLEAHLAELEAVEIVTDPNPPTKTKVRN